MTLSDVEALWSQLTSTPVTTIAVLLVTGAIAAIGIWSGGYFSEIGKRKAASLQLSAKAAALEIVALTVEKASSPRPVIDIKLLNKGEGTAYLTEIVAEVLERRPYFGQVSASGKYDLRIDSDVNVITVSHSIKPNDVDRIRLTLGAARHNLCCYFELQLILKYNKTQELKSSPFTIEFVS